MKYLFYLIGRLFIICFALFFALIATSLFIGFGLASNLLPELAGTDGVSVLDTEESDRTVLAVISAVLGLITGFDLAGLAALPVSVSIAITEMMRWQGLTVQLILGGFCGLFAMYAALSLPEGTLPGQGTVLIALAAGFVAAFFYWLIAGRNAGEWMGAPKKEARTTPENTLD